MYYIIRYMRVQIRTFFLRCQLVTSEEINSSLYTGNMFPELCPENTQILKQTISRYEKKTPPKNLLSIGEFTDYILMQIIFTYVYIFAK